MQIWDRLTSGRGAHAQGGPRASQERRTPRSPAFPGCIPHRGACGWELQGSALVKKNTIKAIWSGLGVWRFLSPFADLAPLLLVDGIHLFLPSGPCTTPTLLTPTFVYSDLKSLWALLLQKSQPEEIWMCELSVADSCVSIGKITNSDGCSLNLED